MSRHLTACWAVSACLGTLAAGAAAQTSGQDLAQAAGQPLLGSRAPRLTVTTIDGQSIDLGALYGAKAVYLKFWATWCVPCREQMPHFEHTYETAGQDLVVIAVNTGFNDSIEDIRAYRRRTGIRMPIVLDDGRLAAAFRLRVTPQHIVIGRDGRIAYVGHLADARLDRALLAARAVPAAPAPPVAPEPPSAAPGPRLAPGARLPERTLQTIDGAPVALFDKAGRQATVLLFFSLWCESYFAGSRPAIAERCRRLREATHALESDRRLRWIGIASGLWTTAQDLRDFRDRYPSRMALSLDESGDLLRTFGITQLPAAAIVDGHGRIRRWIDAQDGDPAAALHRAIEQVGIAEPGPSPAPAGGNPADRQQDDGAQHDGS